MCRGLLTSRSSSSVSSPNAAAATRRAPTRASARSSARSTTVMPFPPPPADGLTSSGYPTRSAAAASIDDEPGITGTPAALTCSLARILSPMTSSALTPGPTNTMPAASHARARSAFSERNPYPGWIASAPCAAATTASMDR